METKLSPFDHLFDILKIAIGVALGVYIVYAVWQSDMTKRRIENQMNRTTFGRPVE